MTNSFENLSVAGVNYHKTALDIRSRFAFSTEQIKQIYEENPSAVKSPFFILSSCNRTEIYSLGAEAEELISVLTTNHQLTENEISSNVFVKKGEDVMKHIFRVASGLDSQIIGDYEITGQLKNAFFLAKSYGRVDGYMEKLINTALQISKRIKNETALSDGTTSVSYAVIQMLKQLENGPDTKRVCLLGLGKIGSHTLKNLRHDLPGHHVTLVNRNEAKAELAAGEYGISYAPFDLQQEAIMNSDILIVATGAKAPIVHPENLYGSPVKMVFDLSVPNNVHPDVAKMDNLRLYNIDEISQLVNQTIEQRKIEVPKAEAIIDEQFTELIDWHNRRLFYLSQKA